MSAYYNVVVNVYTLYLLAPLQTVSPLILNFLLLP
jgi:hypothetical protein